MATIVPITFAPKSPKLSPKFQLASASLSTHYTSIHVSFTFQLLLWQELRKEGLSVEGFCVATGILSTEKAVEIINGLRRAGIKHVAFKPGSVEGIRQVVSIPVTKSSFSVIF
jgi:enoyl reductase-like protein